MDLPERAPLSHRAGGRFHGGQPRELLAESDRDRPLRGRMSASRSNASVKLTIKLRHEESGLLDRAVEMYGSQTRGREWCAAWLLGKVLRNELVLYSPEPEFAGGEER